MIDDDPWSIFIRFNVPNQTITNSPSIIDCMDGGWGKRPLRPYIASTTGNVFDLQVYAEQTRVARVDVTMDEWHNAIFQRTEAGVIDVYLDGVLIGSDAPSDPSTSQPNHFRAPGIAYVDGYQFPMSCATVAQSQRVLTGDEIATLETKSPEPIADNFSTPIYMIPDLGLGVID